MGKSFKKVAITGNTIAESEKWDKVKAHKRFRQKLSTR